MNDLVVLVAAIAALFVWSIWLRYFYFFRPALYPKSFDKKKVYSSAEGVVVYDKGLSNKKDILICKSDDLCGRRLFRIENCLKDGNYYHVGIFMTKYDNHHVSQGISSKIKSIICRGKNNDSSMMCFFDELLSVFGISFFDWLNASEKYIHYNQQYVIEYENGILVVITMDKYVNKFDYEIKNDSETPYELGFVHRGSQTDVFVPEHLCKATKIKVGQRVSYNSVLFELEV